MQIANHIIVCTDFSPASESALASARDLAKTLGSKVTLVHVYSPMLLAQHPGIYRHQSSGRSEELELERAIIDGLEKLREDKLGDLQNVEVKLLADDSASDAIVEFAKKVDADLIVVSSHGRTGLAHFLIGSVAERIVRHAECPVMVARSALWEDKGEKGGSA